MKIQRGAVSRRLALRRSFYKKVTAILSGMGGYFFMYFTASVIATTKRIAKIISTIHTTPFPGWANRLPSLYSAYRNYITPCLPGQGAFYLSWLSRSIASRIARMINAALLSPRAFACSATSSRKPFGARNCILSHFSWYRLFPSR